MMLSRYWPTIGISPRIATSGKATQIKQEMFDEGGFFMFLEKINDADFSTYRRIQLGGAVGFPDLAAFNGPD